MMMKGDVFGDRQDRGELGRWCPLAVRENSKNSEFGTRKVRLGY